MNKAKIMKILIRNLIIILFYLTSVPFWRRLFLTKPRVRVWCLHEVKNHQVGEFEKKIVYLKKHYNIISPEQFTGHNLAKDKLNILITFDDGFTSWLDNVLPILKKHRLCAIFFIEEKFVKYSSNLTDEGHVLGGHSTYHLKRLPELSTEELKLEIQNSVKLDFFAYPFGDKKSFNRVVAEAVKQGGYKYAFTILPGFNNIKTDSLFLHRDSLDADTPRLIFKLWLKGSYDLIKKIL